MLKTDKILGNNYHVKTQWSEITIETAQKLKGIELPSNFIDLYTKEDKTGLEISDDDIKKVFPDIMSEVLVLLSDMPGAIAYQLDSETLWSFYNKYVAPLHIGVHTLSFQVEEVSMFDVDMDRFHLPKSVYINGSIIHLRSLESQQFCEALEFAGVGVEQFHALVAVTCLKKHESYSEDVVINRLELMKQAKMDVPLTVLNRLRLCVDHISAQYRWVFESENVDGKLKAAFNRSGLKNFGTVAWLYEVAQSGIAGPIQKVSRMPLYDFIPILSYLRCQNKLEKYATK